MKPARFRLRKKPVLLTGKLGEIYNLILAAQKDFESIAGKGISFADFVFFLSERRDFYSPRQIVEVWQYFRDQEFLVEIKEKEIVA